METTQGTKLITMQLLDCAVHKLRFTPTHPFIPTNPAQRITYVAKPKLLVTSSKPGAAFKIFQHFSAFKLIPFDFISSTVNMSL